MLCKKCNTENLLKADYCQSCGSHFTKEEKDEAYGKTIFGKFEKAEEYIGYLKPVEIIKGNKLFRAGVLAVIVLYSLFVIITNGNHIRIEESSDYEVLFNKDTGAYYLVAQTPYINAQLHLPPKTETIEIHHVENASGNKVHTEGYGVDSEIALTVSDDYHYIIQTGSTEMIEVYVVTE